MRYLSDSTLLTDRFSEGCTILPIHPLIPSPHHVSSPLPFITPNLLTTPDIHGYLQQHWVQRALGVPVNYTTVNLRVNSAFASTGDFLRAESLDAIAYILDSGVKVALVYGDRDFACNWIGGEEVSLAVDYLHAREFREVGCTAITSVVGVGGQVRQVGNFSFARVFQAGHEGERPYSHMDSRSCADIGISVPSYQPEVAYEIFMRSLMSRDIATGLVSVTDNYTTVGPSSTWHIKNEIPEAPKPTCYILAPWTCTEEQYVNVKSRTAVVRDYVVVEDEGESRANNGLEHTVEEQRPLVEEL